MTYQTDDTDPPVGPPLDFTGPWPLPDGRTLTGDYVRLSRMSPADADQLFDAFQQETEDRNWTYLPFEKPKDRAAFRDWIAQICTQPDPLFYTVFDSDNQAVGFLSYLRISPENGSIEVGWISMSPAMQRSRVSTNALYLMMQHAFDDLGYRRYEWKCDSLNAPSKAAALRQGFTFEGIFRQATHYKGRSRDTAWFSILDSEWPAIKARFGRYLSPDNFDAAGQQIKRLNDV